MIKISSRLKKIADFIENGTNMIDVGCDHALLDIYLTKNKSNMKIIASDINPNALNNAKKNIEKYKVQDQIRTIKSKGLENISDTTIDTIVISGMGSHTIVGILYHDLPKLKNVSTLILQSNNDLDFLRQKITKIGYYIEDEVLVKDSNIIYTIIVFKKGYRFYNKKELYFGPILLKKKGKLFIEMNEKELTKFEKIYLLIPKNKIHHRMITHWKIKMIRKILKNNS